MCGVLVALLGGAWLEREQTQLSDRVIRFHVIANSDDPADQQLKLAVRDRVMAQVEAIYPQDATLEEAQATLEENLEIIRQAGQAVVAEQGYDYPVTAEVAQCWFPTKDYDGFALPAGDYTALRLTVGAGAGKNWWCVAFPPLCLEAASETVAQAAEAGLFTEEQVALVTGEEGYVLKFKAMELLGQWKHFWEWEA